MKTLAEIMCLTLLLAVVILCAACSDSPTREAIMEPETPTKSTEQDRRIYDPVRVEHWERSADMNETVRMAYSTGAITGNTHEQITIIQTQIVHPGATAGEKIILWESVISAYNLTTEDAIERPPE